MLLTFSVLCLALFQQSSASSTVQGGGRTVAETRPETAAPIRLKFSEFFAPGQIELKYSDKLLSLNGKRVRIVGFMAKMETSITDGFYLCARPVEGDESGNGDSDLPPANVFVVLRSAKDREVAFKPRALEATGILELGPKEDKSGHVTRIRLILDRAPRPVSQSPLPKNRPRPRGHGSSVSQ